MVNQFLSVTFKRKSRKTVAKRLHQIGLCAQRTLLSIFVYMCQMSATVDSSQLRSFAMVSLAFQSDQKRLGLCIFSDENSFSMSFDIYFHLTFTRRLGQHLSEITCKPGQMLYEPPCKG